MSDTEKKDKNYAPLFQAQERVPKSFDQVLKHVRLPLLTPYFLHDVVMRTPAVTESAECRALVEEAKETNQKISKVSSFVKEGQFIYQCTCRFKYLIFLFKTEPGFKRT